MRSAVTSKARARSRMLTRSARRIARLGKTPILRLRERGLLAASGLALTEAGRVQVDEQWLLHDGRMPEDSPLRVHVAPMATGSQVVQDPGIFDRLSRLNRKLVALDMEGVAIGQVAALEKVRYTLMVKAVQDSCGPRQGRFAAPLRNTGRCRVPARLSAREPAGRFDPRTCRPPHPPPATLRDYLSSGQAALRSLATPAMYLVARYQVVPFAGRERELAMLDSLG